MTKFNSLKVRGHCMFWAVDGHSPDYVDSLSGAELKAEVEKHIRYMTSITKGKLAQWDVNNELVHGNYFERKTNDPNFTKYMFQSGHAQDPVPKLCLNEYNVVASGEATLTYLAQIQDFKSANVWLGAVGVQSHLPDFTEPDTTLMKYRLDVLSQAGLPIWVTELDVATVVYIRLVLDHLVRKTYHIYIHLDLNSACTKNTPDLHAQLLQFCMYAKHAWPTYTIAPILYVRETRPAYTLATTINQTRGPPPPWRAPQPYCFATTKKSTRGRPTCTMYAKPLPRHPPPHPLPCSAQPLRLVSR
ncbi:hypothetical protein RRG08_064082 [Elysia crispata]|uniref:GH10 domain-containing protein n=1 Tax=Elysia crispata TaxID=231223 RepID=A0AAE1CY69_9GAST|nr:hypothetical protein RRG08_064082 [Elysia crispata]